MHSTLLFIVQFWYLSAELTINHDQTWLDDFAFDRSEQNGWNIHKTAGDGIPDPNPMVLISNTPKYHGPFTSNYIMERDIQCNTMNNARLFVSMLTSYCNTDKRGDSIEFDISDSSTTSFPPYRLNQRETPVDPTDIPFIQNTTAYYYTNHSSSSTIKPVCAQNNGKAKWYRANTHKTYQMTVSGGFVYHISIQIALNRDQDVYVMLSNIAMLCVNIPTLSPTINPTVSPTVLLTTNSSQFMPKLTIESTDLLIMERQSTFGVGSVVTMHEIQATNHPAANLFQKWESTDALYVMSGILLMLTCCCIVGTTCVCITIKFKLRKFHSLDQHQMNICAVDVAANVAQKPSVQPGQSPAQSSTESTHLFVEENSDAASFMDHPEGEEMGEPKVQLQQVRIVHYEVNEDDGYLENITDTFEPFVEVDTIM